MCVCRCRQPEPDAAHADGQRVAHVAQPQPADSALLAQRVPRAAATVQHGRAVPGPSAHAHTPARTSAHARASTRSHARGATRGAAATAQRLLRVYKPAAAARHATPQLYDASVAGHLAQTTVPWLDTE